jgi:hypothetical protein
MSGLRGEVIARFKLSKNRGNSSLLQEKKEVTPKWDAVTVIHRRYLQVLHNSPQ